MPFPRRSRAVAHLALLTIFNGAMGRRVPDLLLSLKEGPLRTIAEFLT